MKNCITKWKCAKHHETIVKTILNFDAPILTTNFDNLLARAVGANKFLTIDSRDKGFNYYYPWECYYAQTEVDDYLNSFAIWHINGTKDYRRSIRLGLSDYMGMVWYNGQEAILEKVGNGSGKIPQGWIGKERRPGLI